MYVTPLNIIVENFPAPKIIKHQNDFVKNNLLKLTGKKF